jgi:spore coat protein SA
MNRTRAGVEPFRQVFHLLDEAEAFSERNGGAISRWAANVLEDGEEVIVCPAFDSSWQFDPQRLYALPGWAGTHRIHPVLYRMHWILQKKFYLRIFEPLLNRMNPGDALYVHNRPECASVLATVAKKREITIVLHMHNSHLKRASKAQLRALKQTPIVFCSEFLREEIQRAIPDHFEHTYVIRNGADGRKFRTEARPKRWRPTIIFSGRLVDYKGVHVLLEAMQVLKSRGVSARCQVVGGAGFGAQRSTAYVRKLERMCPENTELLGYKSSDKLAELLRQADIFCCPSIWNDPFPLAPIEAMACGLPIVASKTGGIPEALAFGGGLMVPPNYPEALANALQRVVEDYSYRQKLSEEAVQSVNEHFLWENVREHYLTFLEGLPR